MELKEILTEIKKKEEQLSWEGTFAEYFEMAVKNPALTRLAHARLYDAIFAAGTSTGRLGQKQYSLFSDELFGIEDTIEQVVEYFSSAGRRLDTRKRILLLIGPPASGKSTLVNLIKKGLENYTRTDQGAVYAIQGCPMQEEPLHLIPPEFRQELREKYGLYIEGELCPHCRWMLNEVYDGNIDEVKVRRISLSESMGIGIGTFVATDPGSQDLTRLTGSQETSEMEGDRLESFGKAFRLNGELDVANRGLMEFIEMFKLDERFLAVLLVLTEEQKIKAPGYGTIYADEAIIAHSNEAEYQSMVDNKKTEGLQDRLMVVRVPYNLRVSDEKQIYEKLLANVDLKGTHIAPLSLDVASIFAVLSRLEPPQKFGMSLIQKLRLYDGQYVERFTAEDARDMHEQSPREGFIGVSPRFVINQISRAVSHPEVNCLDPMDLLQTLWEGVSQSTTLAQEEQERLDKLFLETRKEYDEMAKREVQKAFVEGFDKAAIELVQEYVKDAETYLANPNGHTTLMGEPSDNKEKFMRSLERVIDVQDYLKDDFRREIFTQAKRLEKAGMKITYDFDARLEEAVIRKLCPSTREMGRVLGPQSEQNPEFMAKRQEVQQRLVRERGYQADCAHSLIEHVSQLLNESARQKSSLPKALRWLRG
jgi:serine protein kinase